MRSLRLLLLIPALLLVLYLLYDSKAHEPPTEAATTFLHTLQQNDVEAALLEFGDNTCHCAPEGGYVAYLQYESGYDPNLSFLLGKRFAIGPMKQEALPYNGEKYLLPWDKPEDMLVYVPLVFEGDQRPYFLPLDTAYGYEISSTQLKEFETNPEKDWRKGFTLRLRSSLEPGVVPARDPKAPKTAMERAASDGTLPQEFLKYLHPADAAVIKVGNKSEPASAFAAELPRLKSITMGMKVVRRGLLSRWAVKKAGFSDPIVVVGDREIALPDKK